MTTIKFGDQMDRSKAAYTIVTEAGANANITVGDQKDDSQRSATVFNIASLKNVDSGVLADELRMIANELRAKAISMDERHAAEHVEAAAVAAANHDSNKTADFLRQAGKWALNVATKIGAPVATAALQAVLGL
jgi:hypothetical protein